VKWIGRAWTSGFVEDNQRAVCFSDPLFWLQYRKDVCNPRKVMVSAKIYFWLKIK
jgi:hypothetical protein